MVDLARALALARARRAPTLVDNTFATPALQRPLALGADVVLHSTTKYFGGHSDVQGGALVFARRATAYHAAEHVRTLLGAVASPFNSWLVLRGLRTLAVPGGRAERDALACRARSRAIRRRGRALPRASASHPGTRSRAGR